MFWSSEILTNLEYDTIVEKDSIHVIDTGDNMYTILFNHKGTWIHSYEADNIPFLNEFTVVDFSDIHYMITRIVFQPEQKRYKIFLERI